MNFTRLLHRSVVSLLPLLALCLSIPLAGCQTGSAGIGAQPEYRDGSGRKGPPPWAPAHGYRAKHRYRYYPSAQVYYAHDRGVYFYYREGKWRVSESLPGNLWLNLGDHVTLEMDTDRPYHYHGDVVRHYPPGQAKKVGKGHKKGKGRKK